MRISKKKWLQIARITLLLVVIAGAVVTIRYISVGAIGEKVIPLNYGGTKTLARTTNYGSNDTNPPGFTPNWPPQDGYPTIHNRVGGVGTFTDPITVAINSKTGPDGRNIPAGPYEIGTKFYVPRLHLYFIAEDSCNISFPICTNNGEDKEDSSHVHLDFYNGYSADNRNAIIACEFSYGGYTEVIADPGPGYPLPEEYPNGTSLFNDATDKCIGKELWDKYSDWTIGNTDSGMIDRSVQPPETGDDEGISVDDSVRGTGLNQFNYVGAGWHHCQSCDVRNYGFYDGSNSWSRYKGDYVRITFTGTQIKFYGVTGPPHGIATVSLDGSIVDTIDFYATMTAGNTLLYTSPVLEEEEHTLDIIVTGDMHPDATWPGVNPDRVEITSGRDFVPPGGQFFVKPSPSPVSTEEDTGETPPDPEWDVLWFEDFSTGSIDTSKWSVREHPAGWVNNEQQCYRNDGKHARVEQNGGRSYLVLEAERGSGNCPYISGRMDTQGKYLVQPPTGNQPVRIEANIQLPQGGYGIWPAFWMLGENISTVGWPDCGEIDILEQPGLKVMPLNTIQGTIHGLNDKTDGGRYSLPSGDFRDGYHIFGVDWYTDRLVLTVDGNEYKTVMTGPLGGDQVFNQSFFLILNFAVGGNWPGGVHDSTSFPQQMNVDFVRVSRYS